MFATDRPLDAQREECKRARLIAMPIAGLIVWLNLRIVVLEWRWRAVRAASPAGARALV